MKSFLVKFHQAKFSRWRTGNIHGAWQLLKNEKCQIFRKFKPKRTHSDKTLQQCISFYNILYAMKSIAAFINQDLFHWWKISWNIKIVIEQLKIFQTLLDAPTIDNHMFISTTLCTFICIGHKLLNGKVHYR